MSPYQSIESIAPLNGLTAMELEKSRRIKNPKLQGSCMPALLPQGQNYKYVQFFAVKNR